MRSRKDAIAKAWLTAVFFLLGCDQTLRENRGTGAPSSTLGGPAVSSADASGAGGSGSGTGSGASSGAGGNGAGGESPACVEADRRCERTITYPLGDETSVEIRGNFAPDGWAVGVPMTKGASLWTATVSVPWDLYIQYKFVVNGSKWVSDPASMKKVADGYGGYNSVLEAAACGTWTCIPKPAVRFAVIGDFGMDALGPPYSEAEAEVAKLVKSWSPEFVVTLGDNNYLSGLASTIDQNIGKHYHEFIHPYKGAFGEGASENRFFPCLGNHDWGTGNVNAHTDYFELPGNERYWDIARGPVRIFCLDSEPQEPDGNTPDSIQGAWLKQGLAGSPEPFKIVVMHRPPYSSGSHGPTPWMQWPYAPWGASAVMGGHDHDYERMTVGGIPYFVNGLGGAGPYAFSGAALPGSEVRFSGGFGAMLIEASPSGDTITFQTITTFKLLVDHYALTAPL